MLECALIGIRKDISVQIPFRMIHMEQNYHVEWAAESASEYQDIFGIRLDTENMEIEFYHEIQQMKRESSAE